MHRCTITLLMILLLISCCSELIAEDKLYLKTENGIGQYMLKGEVLAWSGNTLNFKLSPSGLMKSYPNRDVIRVESFLDPEYESGLKLLQQQQYQEAITPFKNSLKQESRIWFKQEIYAQLVICYVNSEQSENAVDTFIQLTSLDPETRHLKLIPLPLLTENKQHLPARKAKILIESGENKYQHLLSAAYLIHDMEHVPYASKKLEQLSFSSDPGISYLAKTQLWRKAMDDKTPDGVLELWQTIHDAAPLELQTIGSVILGEAYAKVGRGDQAVELWLRPWADGYPNNKLVHDLLLKSINLTHAQARQHTAASLMKLSNDKLLRK